MEPSIDDGDVMIVDRASLRIGVGDVAVFDDIAHRVAWMPDSVQPDAGITVDHVLLGDLGMDVGLLDEVRETNRRELESEDRECFYQMLAATGRDQSNSLYQRTQRPFDIEAALTRPEEQQGRLFLIKGTARRGVGVVQRRLRQHLRPRPVHIQGFAAPTMRQPVRCHSWRSVAASPLLPARGLQNLR